MSSTRSLLSFIGCRSSLSLTGYVARAPPHPPTDPSCADDDTVTAAQAAAFEITSGGGSGSALSIVAVVAAPDGSMWVAHRCGVIDRYTAAGRRRGTEECGAYISCMACVGQRMWIGMGGGIIRQATLPLLQFDYGNGLHCVSLCVPFCKRTALPPWRHECV